jgi:hypothetical protein
MTIVTAIAVCFLATVPRGWADDYWQRIADGKPWRWNGEQANLLYCVTYCMGDFDVRIECPKRDSNMPGSRLLTVRLLDGDKEVYSFQATRETVFARDRDVLYTAHVFASGTGCTVSAYDFRAKKELWRTRLQSMSNKPHSFYRNLVTIESGESVLLIRGNETLLRYIEYMDKKTGKTLAQREYPLDQ